MKKVVSSGAQHPNANQLLCEEIVQGNGPFHRRPGSDLQQTHRNGDAHDKTQMSISGHQGKDVQTETTPSDLQSLNNAVDLQTRAMKKLNLGPGIDRTSDSFIWSKRSRSKLTTTNTQPMFPEFGSRQMASGVNCDPSAAAQQRATDVPSTIKTVLNNTLTSSAAFIEPQGVLIDSTVAESGLKVLVHTPSQNSRKRQTPIKRPSDLRARNGKSRGDSQKCPSQGESREQPGNWEQNKKTLPEEQQRKKADELHAGGVPNKLKLPPGEDRTLDSFVWAKRPCCTLKPTPTTQDMKDDQASFIWRDRAKIISRHGSSAVVYSRAASSEQPASKVPRTFPPVLDNNLTSLTGFDEQRGVSDDSEVAGKDLKVTIDKYSQNSFRRSHEVFLKSQHQLETAKPTTAKQSVETLVSNLFHMSYAQMEEVIRFMVSQRPEFRNRHQSINASSTSSEEETDIRSDLEAKLNVFISTRDRLQTNFAKLPNHNNLSEFEYSLIRFSSEQEYRPKFLLQENAIRILDRLKIKLQKGIPEDNVKLLSVDVLLQSLHSVVCQDLLCIQTLYMNDWMTKIEFEYLPLVFNST